MHRGVFCQFPFRWIIYYCHSSKSTGKETGKTHLCAMEKTNTMAIFPCFMYKKYPYVGWWVFQTSPKTPLDNIKMALYANLSFLSDPKSHVAKNFEIYLCVVRYRFEPLLGGLFLSLPNVNEEEKE